jgi:hypothetical protein
MVDRARYDPNLRPTLIAVSNADGETPVTLWADPVTHVLATSGSGGGGGSVTVAAAATGGYTPGKLISAATTNATNIKPSAGTIGYITASSINAAARYLKVYNTSTAPTVGTDIPIHTFLIPGNTAGTGTNIPLPPQGILCSTGISIALTTGATDGDTGAVAANEIVCNYGWK